MTDVDIVPAFLHVGSGCAIAGLLLLTSCGGAAPSAHTPFAQAEAITGQHQKPVSSPALARAALLAQSTLQELDEAMSGEDTAVTYIAVKKSFEEGLVEEWLWINHLVDDGAGFRGQVCNEPQLITMVQVGDTVDVQREEIRDWMVLLDDGTLRGGYTIRLEVEAMTDEERQAFLAASGLTF